jgi:hypothetical protein
MCSRRRYRWRYVFGFVHPASDRTEWWIASTVSTAGMSLVLAGFAKAVGAGPARRIVLVLDGAGWHSSNDLPVPEGIHLVIQPPYTPEVRPPEQLWPLIRESLANRDFVDLNELTEITANRCRELSNQPGVVSARTRFHWWPDDRGPAAKGVDS